MATQTPDMSKTSNIHQQLKHEQCSNIYPCVDLLFVSVEEIYKENLDDLCDIVDGDVDAAVRSVRLRAEAALENLKTRDGNGNNKGAFKLVNTRDREAEAHSDPVLKSN